MGHRGQRSARILGHGSAALGLTRILLEEPPPARRGGHESHPWDPGGANPPKPQGAGGLAVGPGPLLTIAKPVAVAGLVEGAAGAAHRGQEGARRASAATARAGESDPGSRAKRSRGTNSFNSERLAPALQSASAQRSAGWGRAPGEGGEPLVGRRCQGGDSGDAEEDRDKKGAR